MTRLVTEWIRELEETAGQPDGCRNKWAVKTCPECRVPEWKLEKYSQTFFNSSYGSTLEKRS